MKVATLTPLWQVEQRDMVALLGQGKMLINGSLHFEAIAKLQLTA